jgi:RNA polymerase sigma factor (sigma-70 family)
VEASALRVPAGLGRISGSARFLRVRSDEQLLVLFRAGSEDAFSVLHDRYRQRLFAYARQMLGGSRQDAEDAMQDVFLRAYSALRSDGRPVAVRAWLYRVAHNRCIDQIRRSGPTPVEVSEEATPDLRDPLAEAEQREELRRLLEDVRRLPVHQRSALVMRELDGLSYAELADALGVSVAAVKSLLVRARMGLAEAVEARESSCVDIRTDMALAVDQGVRASTRARKHLRDCEGCRAYRGELRAVRRRFAALAPALGPLGLLAKLTGGSGAAALGGSAATGGGAASAGGGAALAGVGATLSGAKVAALVCAAAVVTAEGAIEVKRQIAPPAAQQAAKRVAPAVQPRSAVVAPVVVATEPQPVKAAPETTPAVPDETLDVPVTDPTAIVDETIAATGGAAAPDDMADSESTAVTDGTTSDPTTTGDGTTKPPDAEHPSSSDPQASGASGSGGAPSDGTGSGSSSTPGSGGSSPSSGRPG